jgi:undecaprenyl phosphate-alpha-L-ara4FN deformylase
VKESINAIQEGNHELALHGFHHFRWQLHLKEWTIERIKREIESGRESFKLLTGGYPQAFAAPGWETSEPFFHAEDQFGFAYASDIRGGGPCYPLVKGKRMQTLQIPVTVPTLDELIALGNAEELLDLQVGDGDVYCAHAEFDGITHLSLFARFLEERIQKGCAFVPLVEISQRVRNAGKAALEYRFMPGRSRKVTWQKDSKQ